MKHLVLTAFSFLLVVPVGPARSQFTLGETKGPRMGDAHTQRWTVGMTITATGGPCVGVYGTAGVPTEWPEQDVKLVDEKVSETVGRVRSRTLDGGVVQMLVDIPRLDPGEKAEALMTYEITRRAIMPPADTSVYRFPEKPPADVKKYLGTSPLIDSRNVRIRGLVKEITADKENAWAAVEAIHDWVKNNIEHSGVEAVGADVALREKKAHHEDLAGLFIALCRAKRIPARTVWVPDYCYAEFYLEDDEGKGYWFPCELKEKTTFAAVSNQYLILQKGDNFKVPEKNEPQRFVREFLTGKTGQGLGRPSVQFFRRLLPAQ
ncbi:MAG: transglutaminase domain-containing protein [Planctomycetes bacterium]|nr:transglutaminase domain-containing protein [Planctomycetota bacterium]